MKEAPDDPRSDDEIDWTLVEQLLAMTPAERLTMIVESSRNFAEMLEKKRIV